MTRPPHYPPRNFLFLQGPHGPFFKLLAAQLKAAGASVWRVGFNAGDRAFWPDTASYIPFDGLSGDWPAILVNIFENKGITDIVLYGDTRAVHAEAVKAARARGLTIHVFEEGYLRPYWITYERDGSNGHSRLMTLTIDEMRRLRDTRHFDPPVPPSHWGDLRQHMFYGALYHWFVMARNRGYPNFKPHRSLKVTEEFQLYLKRLLLIPVHALERFVATRRVQRGTFPYHLALLQLEHDASFQMHGPFATQGEFLECVLKGFSDGAPSHHHLVFKAHPLEDGRAPILADIKRLAHCYGITDRVHFVRGGKLARLLDNARTATTVNSTAAQQALWRGIPLRAFGRAVYGKPELVSDQPLAAFYANPTCPDQLAYRQFRDFLLATSQLPGSFYAQKGRRQVLRQVPDMMLAQHDPYVQTAPQSEAVRQQLRIVD
ncbi:MAG: capsule biosynthesis protein CapA [Roseobacter sp.]